MAEAPAASSQHAPYAPTTAALGGVPTTSLDVPITAVYLVLFLGGAVTHMTIFQRNKKRGHKFILSGLLFGFCMSRILSCILRIVWSTQPIRIPLAIAAQVFVAAGVILLFIVNLIFTQRIVRSLHPRIGWSRPASVGLKAYYATVVLTLIMLITCTVQSFYTLHPNTRRIDRDVQLFGGTYFAVLAFLPLLIVPVALLSHRGGADSFGRGSLGVKAATLLASSAVLTLGASFRVGTLYLAPRPRDTPAWYHSKACFYIFDFGVEVLSLYLYAAARVDRRFYVPDGARGSYRTDRVESVGSVHEGDVDLDEKVEEGRGRCGSR